MQNQTISLTISKDDENIAYVFLPKHPKKGTKGLVKKQLRLFNLIENYKGPDIYLDFDESDTLVGIEILS